MPTAFIDFMIDHTFIVRSLNLKILISLLPDIAPLLNIYYNLSFYPTGCQHTKKKRNVTVLYAVGMSVVLKTSPQDHSKSQCVITDWGEECPKQFHCIYQDFFLPFYSVILENGDMTYVTQGSISHTHIS